MGERSRREPVTVALVRARGDASSPQNLFALPMLSVINLYIIFTTELLQNLSSILYWIAANQQVSDVKEQLALG
jgi:hypothetical protein